MVCGSQKEPIEKMVSASGRLIRTGIRHKPDYVKPRKDPHFGYGNSLKWLKLPLEWARKFDEVLG